MSRREQILEIFNSHIKHHGKRILVRLTCQDVCDALQVPIDKRQYLSGSVSSILAKLVKDKVLEYDKKMKGPKGGHVYKLIIKH